MAWLREQGIDVGKTTVGDYAQRLKRAAELDLSSLGLNQVGVLRVRPQCAQIAATAGGDNLVERAWTRTTATTTTTELEVPDAKMATRDAAPLVDHLSSALVRAFGHMLDHPDRWLNAAEIEAATGISQPTVYRRFGNLVAAGALSAKRIGDFRCWTLRPSWERSTVALELQRRRDALIERRGQISDL